MRRSTQPLRVAIDTGGTFTDCVWADDHGRLRMLKVFSTPADPSQAIVEVLRKINHQGRLVILHGTTVGTNTLLERKGARTALVTTAGFEDAIEIGRAGPSQALRLLLRPHRAADPERSALRHRRTHCERRGNPDRALARGLKIAGIPRRREASRLHRHLSAVLVRESEKRVGCG